MQLAKLYALFNALHAEALTYTSRAQREPRYRELLDQMATVADNARRLVYGAAVLALACAVLSGCYASHGAAAPGDAGAIVASPDASIAAPPACFPGEGRCVLDHPCYCRIEGNEAPCFPCAVDCEQPGSLCFVYPTCLGESDGCDNAP